MLLAHILLAPFVLRKVQGDLVNRELILIPYLESPRDIEFLM